MDESVLGRMGQVLEPAIEPLGFDWRIGVGLISSLAAREVIVSTLGTLYSYPRATEESVDDVFFDVARLLVDTTAIEHAIAEGIAFLTGDGTNKPTGILDTTPLTTRTPSVVTDSPGSSGT